MKPASSNARLRDFLLFGYAASGLAGLAPAGEKIIHEGVETGIVGWLEQMAELVNHNMLYAPLGQQQSVEGNADGAGFDIALAPTGFKGLEGYA